ncbi:MAG: DNA replication and repair protein RecF [Cocleimonas sp.]
MWIEKLSVNNCRLLNKVSIELSNHLNLIVGKNASGKTSLLESLSLLSNGRSFRTTHVSEVISYNQDNILISAKIHLNETSAQIGIEKSIKKTRIRINKKDIYSQSELSVYLPITVIHPGSIDLITGSPKMRRSYIDWITFYLFPDFQVKWKEYQHILKQRNFCLKEPKHHYAIDQWTKELIPLQPILTDYRQKAFDLLKPKLAKISKHLLDDEIILDFNSGLPKDLNLDEKSLLDFYNKKLEYDIRLKRTTAGVHRADFRIFMDDKLASQSASRGQLKLIAIALLLSQSEAIIKKDNEQGVLLIDDLASELDSKNKKTLLYYLANLEKQVIITSTKSIENINIPWKVFHVKHGEITEE